MRPPARAPVVRHQKMPPVGNVVAGIASIEQDQHARSTAADKR